jgi:hypothetical protein
MAKELRPSDDLDTCEVCARTLLKGERAEPYLAPGGQRRLVCELCVGRAEASGWIRESAHADQPASRVGLEPRESLLERLGRWWRSERPAGRGNGRPAEPPEQDPYEEAPVGEWDTEEPALEATEDDTPEEELHAPGRLRRLAPPRGEPRHVRAVPTNAQVKVERALEVFNSSQHRRTVAGLARTLGPPWVSAAPEAESPSEVTIVVAWELSWYRYSVDLGDAQDPVSLVEKGHELEELAPSEREWNGAVTEQGGLVAAVGGG